MSLLSRVKEYQKAKGGRSDGQITSNDIERAGLRWAMSDDLTPIQYGEAMVINYDKKGGEGFHWVVLYRAEDGYVLFDPLGPGNARGFLSRIRPWTGTEPLLIYPHRMQDVTSNICGYVSILIAAMLSRSKPKKKALASAIIHSTIIGDATDEVMEAFGLREV